VQRGYGSRWNRARAMYLRAHPLCVECLKENQVTAAREVDHIVAHKGDYDLFWDEANWQPLCKSCHSRKTVGGM
jgi:5-methylcytosine-specific restriction protein A